VQRIGERPRELAQPGEEQGVEIVRAPVDVGRQLAQRVGDQLLLRAPPAVDRVPSDPGALRDRLDRRRLEAALREQVERGARDRVVGRRLARAAGTSPRLGAGAGHRTYDTFRERLFS
jgi:hypothetical protein